MFFGCRHGSNNTSSRQYTKDSLRLQTYFDSVFDLQYDFPDSAFRLWQPAVAEAKEKKIYRPLFSYYKYAVGNRLLLANDTATSYKVSKEAMQLAKQTGDSVYLGIAHFCFGMLYGYKEFTDSSSYYFMQAAEYLKTGTGGKDAGTLLDAYDNLAEMMRIQGDYVNAEKYVLRTVEVTKKRNEIREVAQEYGSLYEIEEALGRSNLAKAYLDSSEKYYGKAKVAHPPYLLRMKGENELEHGSPERSLLYFDSSFRIFSLAGDSLNAGMALLSKVRAFNKMNKFDSSAVNLRFIEKMVQPKTLPLTALREYYIAKLSLPKNFLSAAEREKLSNAYITLLNSFLEKNSKLIGTQYSHQMEQAEKDKLILQQTLQSTRRGKTITQLWAGIIVSLLLALFAGLYWRKKREVEKEKMKLLRQEKDLELLQTRMTTQLEERSRISQELHDDLGATLTSISLATELLRKAYPLEGSREVAIISSASTGMVDKMNEIVWSLNTSNDTVHSLIAYVRKFAYAFLEEAGIALEIHEPQQLAEKPLQGYIRRNLYLTVKEALHNVVKHAKATKVVLQFSIEEDEMHINISDNGKGLEAGKETTLGNGLKNMRSNLKAIGGAIQWTKNEGTQINIVSPVA